MPGKVKDQGKKAAQQLDGTQRLPRRLYETELYRLQGELVKMQEWVRTEGARIVVIFEGRDAAGKGSTIKRVAQYLNPRVARIVALPAPTERERTQWYFQRYTDHLPAAGELALFDRSWYNRAGVEHVMGFCTKEEYSRFLHQCPIFERLLVEDGILLRKYWFSVSDEEQERRFRSRLHDPMRNWKLSPMDLESITRWEDYSRAKDEMFVHTDIPEAPWHVVESEDKRRARINMIAHLLSTIPYHKVQPPTLKLPPRPPTKGYVRVPRDMQAYVPDHAAELELVDGKGSTRKDGLAVAEVLMLHDLQGRTPGVLGLAVPEPATEQEGVQRPASCRRGWRDRLRRPAARSPAAWRVRRRTSAAPPRRWRARRGRPPGSGGAGASGAKNGSISAAAARAACSQWSRTRPTAARQAPSSSWPAARGPRPG